MHASTCVRGRGHGITPPAHFPSPFFNTSLQWLKAVEANLPAPDLVLYMQVGLG